MAAGTQTAVEVEEGDGFVDGAETEILENYLENHWGVVGDLVEEATPTGLEAVDCHKHITRSLTVDDEEMFIELSTQEAQNMDVGSEFMDVHADERDSFVPDEFEPIELDFPRPETERIDACTECHGNGRNQCGSCGGSGANQCGRCGGSGTNSDRSASCSQCGGTGSIVCGSCSGNGSVVCDTCEATGESYKMDFVRRVYDPAETVTVDAEGVPDKFVEQATGIELSTDRNQLATDEIRNETEVREVPVAVLEYTYDGDEYTIYQIEEDTKATAHPQSTARKILPIAVVGVGAVVVALWYVGII
ncbi:hypothetical protein GRS48_03495 [Halorubrum sp. JWXQ-INN 858]|uniref:hypothetical protein n=1 Tax=Halorubrum sp. JWXQ-INN 858 TaxID=2690782 RepID=UPI00135AD4BD|nr:hypothetical protein [Halorubrum sp. JWXQ-INN 858]MWV63890.1 hypothetical protein [Halorubrum sp. JWXQ-INN 858]